VWSADGHLLTSNDLFADGWWTVHALKSSLYSERDGDRFSLQPGETVAFIVDLAALLTACPCLPEGLPSGEYEVQLKSDAGLSNRLRIQVGEAN
jgi:hypothetical protein